MLDFLKNLEPIQIILIIAGLFLFFPGLADKLGGVFGVVKKEGGEPTVSVPEGVEAVSLTNLVAKLESLYNACHKKGLHDACSKLRDAYAVLIDVYDEHPAPLKKKE